MSRGRRLSPEALVVLLLSGLLAAFATLAVATGSEESSTRGLSSNRSSYSTRPDGLKALYLSLQASGFPVTRHRHPWTSLPARATAVISLPSAFEPTGDEWEKMVEWVRRGGLLVYGRRTTPSSGAEAQTWKALPALLSSGPCLEAPDLGVHEHEAELLAHPHLPAHLRAWESGWPLYGSEERIAVTWRSLGQGTFVEIRAPEVLSNEGIPRWSNLRFVLNLLALRGCHGQPTRSGTGAILFDEYHNGYGTRETRSLWSSLPASTRAGLLQILAAALLLVWVKSRRLAPAQPLPPPPRQRSEYLDSMAGLLERAGAHRLVARMLRRRLVDGLARACGLPAGTELPAILAGLDAALAQRGQAVLARLDTWEAATAPVPDQALRAAREVNRILEEARRTA